MLMLCLGVFQMGILRVGAQPLTYTVQQGDTLWDICEKVYGDADLWPKLWEMNPFITNPHLLKPGDVITLLKGVPVLKGAPVSMAKESPPAKTAGPVVAPPRGYDLSSLASIDGVGFLSTGEVATLGVVVAGEGAKVMLGAGDTLFVETEGDPLQVVGNRFTVCSISSLLKDPRTGENLGYLVTYVGTIRILQHVRGQLFKGVIEKMFGDIKKGDGLLRYVPVSDCISLAKADREVNTYIAAVEDQRVMVGQYTIIYLSKGYQQGIRRGQLFEILKKREAEITKEETNAPETVVLPDAVLGYCLVLKTTEDTATGVVLSAKEDIPNGAPMKTFFWKKPPRFLSSIPLCRGE
jgi:hypothetical protein